MINSNLEMNLMLMAICEAIDSIVKWPTIPIHIPQVLEKKSFESIIETIMSELLVSGQSYSGFQAYAHSHESRDDSRKAFLELFGEPFSPKEIDYLKLITSFTLIIREAYKILPIASELRSIWQSRFSSHVNTNIYMSSSTSEAFPLHQDPHHVFVLQLSGAKRWLFSSIQGDEKMMSSTRITSEIVSHSGDMIFIPKGVPHRAIAIDTSVHASISVEEESSIETSL